MKKSFQQAKQVGLEEAVRDICSVAVTGAPKSKVKQILLSYADRIAESVREEMKPMQPQGKSRQRIVEELRKHSAGYGFVTDESIKMFEQHFVYPALDQVEQETREEIVGELEGIKNIKIGEPMPEVESYDLGFDAGLYEAIKVIKKL